MKIDRRSILGLFGAAGVGMTPVRATPLAIYEGEADFRHGVASGDPGTCEVIVWTRVTARSDATDRDIVVDLEVARDPEFRRELRTIADLRAPCLRDHTVKYTLSGLEPGQEYYYRFRCGAARSPVGRTRTLAAGGDRDITLAVASCAAWPCGYYNAYDAIAREPKLDAVVFLGDYIYEYGAADKDYGMFIGKTIGRIPDPPHKLYTLDDYRRRHAQHKTDGKLQAAHARAPWIVVWDDHEVANNCWHEGPEDPSAGTQGDWRARKAAALQAYYEWMPIREPLAGDSREAACRSFRFGDVAELLMVETRLLARDRELSFEDQLEWKGSVPDVAAFNRKLGDPARQMMGAWQEKWLADSLDASARRGTGWQLLGNQVVMAHIAAPDIRSLMGAGAWDEMVGGLSGASKARVERNQTLSAYDLPSNLDSWDGYPAARQRLYDAVKAADARLIVLSGDSHMFWANELHGRGDRRPVAVEFATSSITSLSYGDALPKAPIGEAFARRNREVIYNDPGAKGYVLLNVRRNAVDAAFVGVSTVIREDYERIVLKQFRVGADADGKIGTIETL